MIQLPRRSVTRFFIPLIDVLTLLFCIFLLMPLIKATGEGQDSDTEKPSGKNPDRLGGTPASGGRQPPDDGQRSGQGKPETLQERLFIRVLEIDADTGKLYYYESDQRLEIRNQDDALKLIAGHKQEAANRELYYLFLYPRRLTGYPQQKQIEQYEGWFKGIAHGIDNPLAQRDRP